MQETTRPLSLAEMAQLLLNSDSVMSIYAAYAMLKADRKYFKQISRDPPLYFRMSVREIQLLQQNKAKLEAERKEQDKFKTDVAAVLSQPYAERPDVSHWMEGAHKARIVALRDFAVSDGPSLDSRNLAMESLRACGLSLTPNGAVRLLESIRVFNKHEPLALLRAGIKAEFPDAVLTAAEEIASQEIADPEASIRKDLTHLKVFSIDETGTREIDDAISLEQLPDGKHKWIGYDSVLDLEARKRVISLYVPTGAIPVYPWKVAEGCFSLRTGVKCFALSFGAVLDKKGDIETYEVVPSLIIPQTSLSYVEAEKVILKGSDKDLKTLTDISKRRYAWRKSKGAIEIAMPECDVKVRLPDSEEGDPEVTVVRNDADLNSRSMVSEFMILAGEIAGRMGIEQSLALPFRSQVEAILPKASELRKLPPGPCRAAAIRGRMTRGVTSSTNPQPHASLGTSPFQSLLVTVHPGVDAYVQITSPIRRYSDFLGHVQIKAHLRNETPPLSSSELESLLVMTTRTARMRSKVVDESVDYWLAEFFQQRQSTTWTATVLFWINQSKGIASILLDDLGLERSMRIDRPVTPGTKLTISVAGIDVKSGAFRFEEAPKAAAS